MTRVLRPLVAGCLIAGIVVMSQGRVTATGSFQAPFKVVGGQIVDSSSPPRTVVFKGLVRNGTEMYGPLSDIGDFAADAELTNMAAWGTNLLRVPLSEDLWNGVDITKRCPNEAYFSKYFGNMNMTLNYQDAVAEEVSLATKHGMYVLLDLHFSNPDCRYDQTNTNANTSGGTSTALPGQGALTFWADVSSKFGGNNMVGFEPYNEPHVCYVPGASTAEPTPSQGCPQQPPGADDSNNSAVWANGGPVTLTTTSGISPATPNGVTATFTYQAVGLYRLMQTIRAPGHAPTSLIFLDANSFAGDPYTFASAPSLPPGLTYDNVVYVEHMYPTNSQPTLSCDYIVSVVDWLDYHTNRTPVVFDEIGANDPMGTTSTAMADMMDVFNSHQPQLGWAAFAWTGLDWNQEQAQKITDPWQLLLDTPTNAPTNTGAPVKASMQGTYAGRCPNAGVATPTITKLVGTAVDTGVTAGVATEAIDLSWMAPPSGISDATSYTITYTDTTVVPHQTKSLVTHANVAVPSAPVDVANVPVTYRLDSLPDDHTFDVSVAASTVHGSQTAVVSVSTPNPPDMAPNPTPAISAKPGDSTATPPYSTDPSTGSVTVTWTPSPPNVGGPVQSYALSYQSQNGDGTFGPNEVVYDANVPAGSGSDPITKPVHNLNRATTYRFIVRATNADNLTSVWAVGNDHVKPL